MKKRTIGMKCYDGYTLDHWDLRDKNSSRTYTTGSRWCNKRGEWYIIVGQLNKFNISDKGHRKYVFFLALFDDGHYNQTRTETIRRNNTVNPYTPTIGNKGFRGQGPWETHDKKGQDRKLYNIWCALIQRCYDPLYHPEYNTYTDCEVDERWFNFQNFCHDLSLMENFKKYNKPNSRYALDKDIKIKGNRLYSKDTCLLVPYEANIDEMNKRVKITGLTYIGINKKLNLVVEFTNQREFCREHKLNQSNVWGCINNYPHCRSTKGWTFKVKEDTDGVS